MALNSVPDVFLSYRRSDGMKLAQILYDWLTGKGLNVFLDKEKMIGGQYFDEQIKQNIINAPNYIFIGTPDAFAFRSGETDYVAEEIKIAISEHDKAKDERVVLPVIPAGSDFPDSSVFPEGTERLPIFDGVFLSGAEPTDAELRKILGFVTAVNKHVLWNAGHRWLRNSRNEGARFAALHIDEVIMPKAGRSARGKEEQPAEFPINVYRQSADSEEGPELSEEQGLLEALGSVDGHIYLIGQGGIGKTTALVSIMNKAYEDKVYSPDAQVPLFIELSRAPDTNDKRAKLYTNGISTFIRRAIYQQIRQDRSIKQITERNTGELDEAFTADPVTSVDPVTDLLTEKTSAPEYLLLLDGLNETSRSRIEQAGGSAVVSMIIAEIQWIIDNCPNVRVILTSRTDDTAIQSSSLTHLYLKGVEDDTIRGYLESKGLPRKRIEAAFADSNLIETIRVPLFLTMYASLKDAEEVSTQGEIFRVFFSERSGNIGVYTAQGRINAVNEDVKKAASETNPKRITAMMQSFFLDFIVPEIAWSMERAGKFYIDEEDIAEIIEPLLTGTADTDVCGRHGKKLFEKYRKGFMSDTRRVAESILKLGGGSAAEAAKYILDCVVFSLCVMQENDGEYGFMHHHIRDYFAAVRNIDTLRLAVYAFGKKDEAGARERLGSLIDMPAGPEVRRLMGEYLREHRNAPVFENGKWRYNVPAKPDDRNLIKRALDILRGEFGGGNGYAVFNLIEILKAVRKDLSGADLSRLDLTGISLNGVDLGERGGGAVFRGSKLTRDALFPMGHSNYVRYAAFSPDDRKVLTLSSDRAVKVWDALTGAYLFALRSGRLISSALFSPDGTKILAVSAGRILICDAASGQLLSEFGEDEERYSSAAFRPDGSIIAASYVTAAEADQERKRREYSTFISVWDAAGKQIIKREHPKDTGDFMSFSPDGKKIASAVYDFEDNNEKYTVNIRVSPRNNNKRTANISDADSGSLLTVLRGHTGGIKHVSFSADGSRIVTASQDRTANIWDADTGSPLLTLEGNNTMVSAVFSPDGGTVAAASGKTVQVWDAASGAPLYSLEENDEVNFAAFSNDGTRLITSVGSPSGGIIAARIWSVFTRSALMSLEGRSFGIKSLSFSSDGTKLAAALRDGTARIWDAEDHSLSLTLTGHNGRVRCAELTPDGTKIVTVSDDRTIRTWDAETGSPISSLSYTPIPGIFDFPYISPDKKRTLRVTSFEDSGDGQNRTRRCGLELRDIASGSPVMSLDVKFGFIFGAAFSPEGDRIAILSGEHDTAQVQVYDTALGAVNLEFKSSQDRMKSVISYSDDGKKILTISYLHDSYVIEVRDAGSGSLLQAFECPDPVMDTRLYRDCSRLSAVFRGEKTNYLKTWDTNTGELLFTTDETLPGIQRIYGQSPDGKKLLVRHGITMVIFDADTGRLLDTKVNVSHAVYSPDGKRLATVSGGGILKFFDTDTGEELCSIYNVPGLMVKNVSFKELHPESEFSDKDRETLKRYGAII